MTTDAEPTNPGVDDMPSRASIVRRHPWAFGILAGVIAVVLVSGLTAWGVTALVRNEGTTAAAMAPMSSGSAAPTAPLADTKKGVRGTITSIDGSKWTIDTKAGPTVTISVTSTTVFGTKAMPASASDFAVGDTIAAIGTRTGDTGVATRVVKTDGAGATPTPSASPNT